MKKVTIICLGLITVICLITYTYLQYGIPKKIDFEFPAVIYRVSDKSLVQNTKIEIHLKKYKIWNSSPKYIGNISVDAFSFTKQPEMMPVRFMFDNNKSGFLTYVHWITNKSGAVTGPAVNGLGSIRKVSDFKKISIRVFEPTNTKNMQTEKDLYISGPANTREEAIRITELCDSDK